MMRLLRRRYGLLMGWGTAVTAVYLILALFQQNQVLAAPGDPVAAIDCGGVYTATVYAEGLSSPDGLAFGGDGLLYVAEEAAGRVSQIDSTGFVTPVLTGLSNPEGIAFDGDGNLYVVEDVLTNGRLIRRTPGGMTSTITSALVGSEGVVVAPNGTIYVTESNVEEFISDPTQALNARSYVTAVSPGIGVTRILTSEPSITQISLLEYEVEFLSFSGLDWGSDGLLYVANESSGLSDTGSVSGVTFTVTTTKSIITVDSTTGNDVLFSSNLVGVEGVRFSAGGQFPLYAVEEDLGSGNGQLSRVDMSGISSVVCTGFGTIEDVIADDFGRLYVSEDVSGNGRVIRLDKGNLHYLYLPTVQNP